MAIPTVMKMEADIEMVWDRFYETVSAGNYGQNLKKLSYKCVSIYTLTVFDLTTHCSSLLGGRQRRNH
jgi:hypothetical protein